MSPGSRYRKLSCCPQDHALEMDFFLALVSVSTSSHSVHGLLPHTQVLQVGWEMYLSAPTPLSDATFLSLFFLQNRFVAEEAVLCAVLLFFLHLVHAGCSLASAHSTFWKRLSSMLPQTPNCWLRGLFQSFFLWDLFAMSILMATSLLECVLSFWLLPQNSITGSFASVHPRPQHEFLFSQLKTTKTNK